MIGLSGARTRKSEARVTMSESRRKRDQGRDENDGQADHSEEILRCSAGKGLRSGKQIFTEEDNTITLPCQVTVLFVYIWGVEILPACRDAAKADTHSPKRDLWKGQVLCWKKILTMWMMRRRFPFLLARNINRQFGEQPHNGAWYFESRWLKAGLVPSRTSMLSLFSDEFSIEPES